jgi:hypothetical protein
MNTRIAVKMKILAAGIAAALVIAPAGVLANQTSHSRPAAMSAAQATVDWQIPLKPGSAFRRATGSAQYQSQPGQSELQLEVEHLRSLAGKRVAVSVNGAVIGVAKVSARGIAELHRNTELGQSVPTIVHGSTVTVRTSKGRLVASGRF